MQFHQQARHGIQQACPVPRLVGRQTHEQPAVLPGPFEVAGDQDRGVEFGLQHQARGTHCGKAHFLEPAQDVVLLGRDPLRHVFDGPQRVVGLDELHQVPAGSDGDVAQWNVGNIPLRQRSVPRECEQSRRWCPESELRCTHARLLSRPQPQLRRSPVSGWNKCTEPSACRCNRTVSANLGALRGLHRATNSTPEPACVYTYASLPRSSTRSTTTSTPPVSVSSSCSGRMPKVTSERLNSFSLASWSRSSSRVESPILTPSAAIGTVTRFIAGEPMKPATNALAGRS